MALRPRGLRSFAVRVARNAEARAAERAAAQAAERAAAREAASLAVPRAAKALPAPPKVLALPAPGPGLPPFAVKPKGGQWWADKSIGAYRPSDLGLEVKQLPGTDGWLVRGDSGSLKIYPTREEADAAVRGIVDSYNRNQSPERASRIIADEALGLSQDANGPLSQLQNWFLRTAPRYIKNELGTPEDPLRGLAERGALHVALSPDEWSASARKALREDTIGDVLGLNDLYVTPGAMPGAGYDYRANVLLNMPWLEKAPVTDKVFGIADTRLLQNEMGMEHMLDEMKNALSERSDLPPELRLRPESLDRMSLAAAAERVGLINQFRAKQMEQAALDAQNNPVTHIFKEYAEDNPKGLRWVEMAPPKGDGPFNYDVEEELGKALKYEGDTMGHCVGGYCPDVLEGRSRIFSLRDAKGEPHVTIETQPSSRLKNLGMIDQLRGQALDEASAMDFASTRDFDDYLERRQAELLDRWKAENPQPDDIIQIKGKQNRAPKDDYLPFVQDFVKSQQWGNVGDLSNTGLVRLPDGRYITEQQMSEGMARARAELPDHVDPSSMLTFNWPGLSRYFEGYAIGGRVDPDRCFCRHPMSVR